MSEIDVERYVNGKGEVRIEIDFGCGFNYSLSIEDARKLAGDLCDKVS